MIITEVEVSHVRIPFADRVRGWAELDVPQLRDLQVVRLLTDDPNLVGIGEQPYVHQVTKAGTVSQVIGRSPAEVRGWDWLGRAIQMAAHDLLGRQLGVPVWQLLGAQCHRRTVPVSWWSSSLTPRDQWAAEARAAHDAGYRTHKIKAYPWMDLPEVARKIVAEVGDGYSLDLDFNGMLRTRGEALSVLQPLADLRAVGILESPCRIDSTNDLVAVRDALARPLAEHWRAPWSRQLLESDAVDGFVFATDGVTELMQQLAVADHFNKAGWLQMLGTDLTTTYALHLSAAGPAARWPVVTCAMMLEHPLVTDPITMADGVAEVPMAPGLGVELDPDALARYTVTGSEPAPAPPRHVLSVGDALGEIRHHRSFRSAWLEARNIGWGQVRAAEPYLSVRLDDGTSDFDAAWQAAEAWLPTAGAFDGFRR
ncbi:mandelate racemase/muconate lactonizing enzyme family protein [Propionibacteriaceae bacterium Y2011]|uniref:mandelate racemase/muconate lactonizing enzyme family protein n=1 Tax=Microlunatus sp. Y2014 TaxID=3418488 RepID=UPI003B4661DD